MSDIKFYKNLECSFYLYPQEIPSNPHIGDNIYVLTKEDKIYELDYDHQDEAFYGSWNNEQILLHKSEIDICFTVTYRIGRGSREDNGNIELPFHDEEIFPEIIATLRKKEDEHGRD